MSVPAWPMPIQNTKFVMSNAQFTGLFDPHTPTPVEIRYEHASTPPTRSDAEMRNAGHHQYGCGFSVISALLSFVLIGLLGFVFIGVWMVVRSVMALVAAQKHAPIRHPLKLLW